MQNIKVLHLISGGDSGGAKTHVLTLFKGFRGLVDARIICFMDGDFYQEAKAMGLNIELMPQPKRYDMTVVKKIKGLIKAEGIDIVHCHGARANFISLFLGLNPGFPIVTTIHSDYLMDFKGDFYKNLIYGTLNRIALRRMSSFICISKSFKEMMISRGFKSKKLFTVENGIDLDEHKDPMSKESYLKKLGIEWSKDDIFVGIISRLHPVKDHETFLLGAKKALEINPGLKFIIAGDGDLYSELKDFVKRNKIDNVYFIGYERESVNFYNLIDINVLTSLSESFPYVLLEGSKYQKPSISTDVGGVHDLLGDHGILIEVGDYETLGKEIASLSLDKERRDNLGNGAYCRVRDNFSKEEMARKHFEIYKRILGGNYEE